MQGLKEEEEEVGESREGANGGRETQFPLGDGSDAGAGWQAEGAEGAEGVGGMHWEVKGEEGVMKLESLCVRV